MKTLTAVLFAGGESRRMGRDKATLEIDGEPLWSRQLRTVRELRPEKVLISVRTRPAWCPPEIETVLDEPPSHGPLSGLAAALGKIQTTHLLALAIDLPKMTAAHLEELWAQARPGCGVVPSNGGNLEPLCAIYPVETLVAARSPLTSEDVSLQNFARTLAGRNQIRFHAIKTSESSFYQNVNTQAEFIG